jgi:hypothetical protein
VYARRLARNLREGRAISRRVPIQYQAFSGSCYSNGTQNYLENPLL